MLLFKKIFIITVLLFIIPSQLFSSNNFGKLCNKEVLKDHINTKLILEYCTQAGKDAIQRKSFGNASWYYLLSNKLDKNINEIQTNIDDGFLVNIGHSYLLKNDLNNSKKMYKIFLKNSSILWVNKKIQKDFKTLFKRYPKKKSNLLQGLKIWDKIYKPLKPIADFYKSYRKAKKKKRYNKAIEYLIKIISLEKKYHKNNSDISMNYNHIGEMYKALKKYNKALKFYQKDLNLTKRTFGKNNSSTALSYHSLGNIYKDMKQYSNSLKNYQEALVINKKLFTINHPFSAIICNHIGNVYKDMGKYNQSLKYYQEALSIRKNIFSENYIPIATSYNKIGLLYLSKGEYSNALTNIQKALKITEKTLGINHYYTATIYNNMGLIYESLGKQNKALIFFQKALEIKEKRLKKNDFSIYKTYNNIGQLYTSMGDYSNALIFYKKVLEIKKIKQNHNIIGTTYNNIAGLYKDLGEYNKALNYYNKALKIFEKVPLSKATIYNNMGLVYTGLDEYQRALNYYQKALKLLPKNNPFRANIYSNIGLLYNYTNNYPKALNYYKQALIIKEKILSSTHPDIATLYNNIGLSYTNMKHYDKALKAYNEALNLKKEILSKNHFSTAITYNGIARVYFSMKEYTKAYNNSHKSFKIFIQNRSRNFTILSSKEKEKYLKNNTYIIEYLLSTASKYLDKLKQEKKQDEIKKLKIEILKNWMSYKGILFEYQNILNIIWQKTKDKDIKKLRNLTQQLANLEKKQIIDINPKKYQEKISVIQNEIAKLEIDLGNNSTNRRIRELFGLKNIKISTIVEKLQINQLYIDFAKTNNYYYIFTLNKNSQINFIQIDEEDSKKLEKNIKNLQSNNEKMIEAILKETIKQKEATLKQESLTIFSKFYNILISKYLIKDLEDKESLIISPDGLLNFLPFEALYHKNKYLIQNYQISYISSGREFIRQTKREKANPKYKMIYFGNPDFNSTLPIAKQKGIPKQNIPDTWKQYKNFTPIGDAEIKIIQKLYKNNILIYEGNEATINNLIHIESSKILHFSTHGKFLNNEEIRNPMLRVGLALTGANNKGQLTGIITALELSALDLQDTELIVLSACESGLGKIQNAEGVIGLPKAFSQAGARNIVMSLWSVSNQKTAKLMNYFYKNINEGQEYTTALKNAKIKMIEMHPYYWSAFIIHGTQSKKGKK